MLKIVPVELCIFARAETVLVKRIFFCRDTEQL
jgi:hypothetical protein